VLSGCQKGGQWQRALYILWSNESNESSDLISYNSAISACEEWEWAIELLRDLQDKKMQGNDVTCSAAISACGRCREWQRAIQLLMDTVKNRCLACGAFFAGFNMF